MFSKYNKHVGYLASNGKVNSRVHTGNYSESSEVWSAIIVSANAKMRLKSDENILEAPIYNFEGHIYLRPTQIS